MKGFKKFLPTVLAMLMMLLPLQLTGSATDDTAVEVFANCMGIVYAIDKYDDVENAYGGVFILVEDRPYFITDSNIYCGDDYKYMVDTVCGTYKLKYVDSYVNSQDEGFAAFTGSFDTELKGFVKYTTPSNGEEMVFGYYDPSNLDMENLAESMESEITWVDTTSGDYVLLDDYAPEAAIGSPCVTGDGFVGIILETEDMNKLVSANCIFREIIEEQAEVSTQGSSKGSEGSAAEPSVVYTSESTSKEEKSNSEIVLTVIFAVLVIAIIIIFLMIRKKTSASSTSSALNIPESFDTDNYVEAGPLNTNGAGRVCIAGNGGTFNGQKFEIQGQTVIGRDPARCRISYPADEAGISAVHCMIQVVNGKLEVTDLESSYGTFVNLAGVPDKRLEPNQTVLLSEGESFYLADKVNTFIVSY